MALLKYVVCTKLYDFIRTENHFKKGLAITDLSQNGSKLASYVFLADCCTKDTISTKCDKQMYIYHMQLFLCTCMYTYLQTTLVEIYECSLQVCVYTRAKNNCMC